MWKNLNINKQNVEHETGSATLIKMPNNSEYKGYSFWHPSKLIRSGRHGGALSLGYTEDFTFKLKKMGNGKYNKFEVISEKEISAEVFEECFGVANENIEAPKTKSEFETKKPEEKSAVENNLKKELLDA